MPTFPLATPETYGIASVAWNPVSGDGYARNPHTGTLIKQIFDSRYWTGTLTVTPQGEADGRGLAAWLTALKRGGANAGTFYLGPPSAGSALGSASATPGTPVVNGADQTGEDLDVSGLPTSATGYLLAGDYIQIGTGTAARLKLVLDDVDSDGSGEATIAVWPPIRTAPSNGSAVVVSDPVGVFVAPAQDGWAVESPYVVGVTIPVAEVVP